MARIDVGLTEPTTHDARLEKRWASRRRQCWRLRRLADEETLDALRSSDQRAQPHAHAAPSTVLDIGPAHMWYNDGAGGYDLTLSWQNLAGATIPVPCVTDENRRRVSMTANVYILDDDGFLESDDSDSWTFARECLVDPFKTRDSFSFEECVDDEVRVHVKVECTLDADLTTVNVKATGDMYEGTHCANNDHDGSNKVTVAVPACGNGCNPTPLSLHVDNDDEGGDEADFNLSMYNNLQF